MFWIVAFYWVVCGIVAIGYNSKSNEPLLVTFICFMLGGFIIPAILVRKVIT